MVDKYQRQGTALVKDLPEKRLRSEFRRAQYCEQLIPCAEPSGSHASGRGPNVEEDTSYALVTIQ